MRPSYTDNLAANNFKSFKDLRNFARKNEFENLRKEMGGELSTRELSFKIDSSIKSLDLSHNYSQINASSYSTFPVNNSTTRLDQHAGKTTHNKYLDPHNLQLHYSSSDQKDSHQSILNLTINPNNNNLVSRNKSTNRPNHRECTEDLLNQIDNLLGIDSNPIQDDYIEDNLEPNYEYLRYVKDNGVKDDSNIKRPKSSSASSSSSSSSSSSNVEELLSLFVSAKPASPISSPRILSISDRYDSNFKRKKDTKI